MSAPAWQTVPTWSPRAIEARAAEIGLEVRESPTRPRLEIADDGLLFATVATYTVRPDDGHRCVSIHTGTTPRQRVEALALAVQSITTAPEPGPEGPWRLREDHVGELCWLTSITADVRPDDLAATLEAAAAPATPEDHREAP